ncbi:MlaD family protein [Silvimonas iriomotensis]|uniref:Glycerophosphoryl diester phosphodiesterase n=1 Tax=Silvimonas iriomotensis TaxID=449662 RepID=A0ABQ2PCR7_9NEIS|nr:MlaD family protein [Silvimonas iriomotensis]GGP23252.1 glycerophosphoryl diester phosphodiesterase [Silvimonas iriomotensis]
MTTHNRHYFRLGLFVVLAVVTAAILFVAFGANRWLGKRVTMETYFDESVQGLDVGSKVRYRGVTVGEVSKISFTYTKYQQDSPPSERLQYVLVEMRFRPDVFGGRAMQIPSQENLQREIDRGLRVRLTPQGLTGTSYVEIDYYNPYANKPLVINWKPQDLYIPSAHSAVSQLMNATQDVITRMQKLDIETTVDRLNHLLATTDNALSAIPVEHIARSIDSLAAKLDKIQVGRLADDTSAMVNEVRATSASLHAMLNAPGMASAPANLAASTERLRALLDDPQLADSIKHLDQTMARLDRLTAGNEGQLSETLMNLHSASEDLRRLTDRANNNPGSLLFGSMPTPYPLPTP